MNNNIVKCHELKEESYKDILKKIDEGDPLMGAFLDQYIEGNENEDINEDVLSFIADSINTIRDMRPELNYEKFIIDMLKDATITTEWFSWFNEYFAKLDAMDIDSFSYVFGEFYPDNDIPLNHIKRIIDDSNGDVIQILDKINAYIPTDDIQEPEIVTDRREEAYDAGRHQAQRILEQSNPNEEKFGLNDMFESFLAAVTYKNREDQAISVIQSDMNKILAKFQLTTTELTNYATEIFRSWEKDKDQINKLESLCSIQKNMLASQQMTISELKNEIAALKNRIYEDEKADIKRESLNHKLLELQGLMSELDRPRRTDTFDMF